jgi:VWFA-related protein
MFCSKCGAQLKDDARFCAKCGAPVKMKAPVENNAKTEIIQEPKLDTVTPEIKKVPDYKPASSKEGGVKTLALVAIICLILAIIGVLGFIFYPTVKDKFFTGSYQSSNKALEEEDKENEPKDDESDVSATEGTSEGEDETQAAAQAFTGEKQDINIEVRQVDNSDFPNMTVYVNITDQNGEVVENLSREDFDITEIDKSGNVSTASIEDVHKILGEDRINVNLVLDASGSMSGNKMTQAKNAANSLLDYMSLDTGDKVEVISFDDYVYLEQDFTSRQELLAAAVDGIDPDGATALYDAIYAGVFQTYYENGAKCVIAFTDGEENASSYTFDDVVTIAKNTGIPVFIIGIGDYSYDAATLRELATECSGRYYSANDSDLQSILEDIYIGIYQEQQDYYVFKYTASDTSNVGEFRDLVIDTSEVSEYRGHYVKSYVPESDINGAFSKEYMNKDYILDFTSTREVTESDLAGLSLAELRIARNEIFARHGRQFKDPLLNQWFYSKNWYLSIPSKYSPADFDKYNPDPLSSVEQRNTNFILQYEKNIMNTEDIYPHATTELLTGYDLALSKPVLKTALAQMNRYQSTTTLEENKRLVQEAIDNPDVSY